MTTKNGLTKYGIFAACWATVLVQVGPQESYGRTPLEPQAANQQETDKKAKIYVAFRMRDWQSKHIHDADVAKKHADTLKQLGCEVKTGNHGNHMDVTCRTVYWKSLALDNHDQAHQWVDWLKQSGFETIHGHKVGTHKHEPQADGGHALEIVQYRLADWKSYHVHGSDELSQLLALLRALGCEVETHSHDGHNDVKSRCGEWMEIEVVSHEAAHSWQKFLGDKGFETKHEH